MHISTFEDLLSAAGAQAEPQTLLLAFARAEPEPDTAPGAQPRVTLVPTLCVDKAAAAVQSFGQLAGEADSMGQPWDVMLVTSLASEPRDASRVEQALRRMIQLVREGRMTQLLAFDRDGELLRQA
ncbi:hypothetical protein [Duganella radicis]|uniref:Uncharacterized protein n=1 Tax=Duganella radicis TaxID=551988 RepID=A0A6L6PGX5_9BURK|nr:hypothetical protein [Duganella radicis]MTV37837.1 hypothetical protein [Duganella radicis]